MFYDEIGVIVVSGSSDGVLTAAALNRLRGREAGRLHIELVKPYSVNKIKPRRFPRASRVAIVNLAVCSSDQNRTVAMLRRIVADGHKIVMIIDEHNSRAWSKVLRKVGIGLRGLVVQPKTQSRTRYRSSGAILFERVRHIADQHCRDLLKAADRADRLDFNPRLADMVNRVCKSCRWDDGRREYLIRHLAFNCQPDHKIRCWIDQYRVVEANNSKVFARRIYFGKGLVRVDVSCLNVDRSGLLARLYRDGARVVAMVGQYYSSVLGRSLRAVAFQARDSLIDLRRTFGKATIGILGGRERVIVDCRDEQRALAVVRRAVRTFF